MYTTVYDDDNFVKTIKKWYGDIDFVEHNPFDGKRSKTELERQEDTVSVTNDTSGGHFERLANCTIRHEVIIEEETRIRQEIADEIREKVQALHARPQGLRRARFTSDELSVEGSVLMNRDATHNAPKDGRVVIVDDSGKFWIVERWLNNPRLFEPTAFTHDIVELHLYRQEDLRLLWDILT